MIHSSGILMPNLNGVDLIVFTGGIGENDGGVRAAICDGLSWIGVSLDASWNDLTGRCAVLVLPSQEDAQIARHSWALSPRSLPMTHRTEETL